MRTYSNKGWPHRILFDYDADPQCGDDIKIVRRHTLRRLEARGVTMPVGPDDGKFRRELLTASKQAAHLLGVPDEWTKAKTGLLVREQRVVIYPETRTADMLAAADARMDALVKQRDAEGKPVWDGKLTANECEIARKLAVSSFRVAYDHRDVVHYTQGATRWQGISEHRRSETGHYPNYADCSGMYTWCWWDGLTFVDGPNTVDRLNGCSWTAGFTGTLLNHGWAVDWTDRKPGDAVIYGYGYPGRHVAMVANDTGYVFSHGSEAAPLYLPWNYRKDIMSVRRYIP